MTPNGLAFIAFLPVFLAGLMLAGFDLSARKVMPGVLVLTIAAAAGVWGLDPALIGASVIQGLFVTFDILVILFGAILLLNLMRVSGAIQVIRLGLVQVSPDRRVQALIMVWFFGSFLEGAAGFGTPAAVVAPFLVSLGFPPLAAVMLGMMVQSTAVTFGAVGTPVLVGVSVGLSGAVIDENLVLSPALVSDFIEELTSRAVTIHAVVGSFMPLIMVAMLGSVSIDWNRIPGTDLSASSTPLYLPGTVLLLVCAFAVVLQRIPVTRVRPACTRSLAMLGQAGFVLLFTIPMVRLYINSGMNFAGLPAMPIAMAHFVAGCAGEIYPLFVPAIGALGAFIAGSNTVSNLMFGLFQFGVAREIGVSGVLAVTLQAVGAAAGNMVAVHNVVAAAATAGINGKEGQVLRLTLVPTGYYVGFSGILGLIAAIF